MPFIISLLFALCLPAAARSADTQESWAVLENRGEGSEWAAPVVRRMLENYFFDRTLRAYPWEIRIGVPEWLVPEPPEEGNGGDNG